jgi:TM2 domain-containing membrane protein YozV
MEIRKMADEKKRKNPTIALILSAIFPGLGHIYVKQIPKGVILIVLNLIINFLLINPLEAIMESVGSTADMSTLYIVLGYTVAGLILWIYAIIDAKKTAERINKELEA